MPTVDEILSALREIANAWRVAAIKTSCRRTARPAAPVGQQDGVARREAARWIYPHFLETSTYLAYLYAAPTGLIPCPTLSIVIGAALVVNGLGSLAFSAILGVAGLFYGITGVAQLHVTIDAVLIFGAVAILIQASTRRPLQPS